MPTGIGGAGTSGLGSGPTAGLGGTAGGRSLGNDNRRSSIYALPAAEMFFDTNADIWTGVAGAPSAERTSQIPILLCGSYPHAQEDRILADQGYTHIALIDANHEVRDSYRGSNTASATTPDFLAIPADQTSNYWRVVFSCDCQIPGLGRKKVVLLDRNGAPGDWTILV